METQNYRFAAEADVGLILTFIRELADYEKMLPEVVATEELLQEWIFAKWLPVKESSLPGRSNPYKSDPSGCKDNLRTDEKEEAFRSMSLS